MDLFYPEDPRHLQKETDGKWEDVSFRTYSKWIRGGYNFIQNCRNSEVSRALSDLEIYFDVVVGDKAFDFETGELIKGKKSIFARPK